MKHLHRFLAVASAAFFIAGPALAQIPGEVTSHAFLIGKGPGVTGYTSLLCGSAQLAVGQAAADPICRTITGDVTITAGGVTAIGTAKVTTAMMALLSVDSTVLAANAVTNAKLATMGAFTFKGNNSGSAAVPTDVDIGGLTQKISPAGTDEIMIRDNAASGAWKRSPVSALGGGGSGVSSLNGQTGALVSYFPPQGRLTLATGVSVMQSSQAGATTVYYTPHAGNFIILYDGTNFVPTAFSEVSQATTDATKSPAAVAASSCYDIFGWSDAGTFRATRGPVWTNTTTRSAGTALVKVNSIWLNNVSITNGPAASRGTWLGTICSNASSTIDYIFGAIATGGTAGVFNVWNTYNRVPVRSFTGELTSSWTDTTAGWRLPNSSTTMRATFAVGQVAEPVMGEYNSNIGANAGTVGAAGVALNSTTVPCGRISIITNATPTIGPVFGRCDSYPVVGQNFLTALEYDLNTVSLTYNGSGGGGAFQGGLNVELWQ